jgi:glycosyltransferase involved in cell wall biosynthesis
MGGSAKPAVLIVDPSLRSADGHHLGVLDRYRTELAKLGLGSVSLVSHFMPEELARKQRALPTFERSIYGRTQWTHAEFEDGAQIFCDDLCRQMRALRLRPDIVIFPAADQATILGLARYLQRCGPGKPPEILLWLMMAPHFKKAMDDPSIAPLLVEYEEAFAALRKAVADDARIHVYSETEAMARAYEPYAGLKIEPVIVHKLIERPRKRRRRPGEAINIVCTGNANVAKGYSLLPEAIEALMAQRDDLRFLVHGTVEQTDYPDGRDVLARLATLGPRVKARTDVLSAEDYLARLAEADLVLQPYDPLVYRTRGSGVFAEALKLGIPVVATKGCAFAQQAIGQGRAMGIDRFDAQSVADAVLAAAGQLDALSARATAFAASLGVDESLRRVLANAVSAAQGRLGWLDRALKHWPWSKTASLVRVRPAI